MLEYLIRSEDGDIPLPHVDQLPAVVHPPGRSCEPLEGPADHVMRCDGVWVALSFEEPGIHVVVDVDDEGAAGALVDDIAAQVAAATGAATSVVPR